jgi:ribosomal protein S18 acetylase RimI-like enzyme
MKFKKSVRKNGLGKTALKLIGAASRPLFEQRRYVFMKRSLDIPLFDYPPVADLTFREFFADEIDCIWFAAPEKKRYFIKHFDQGARGFLSEIRQKPICYSFAAFKPIVEEIMQCTIPVAPDEAYAFDAETARQYRGRGVALAHTDHFWAVMRQEHCRSVTCLVDVANKAGMRLNMRLGFTPYASLSYQRVLRSRHTAVSPLPPGAQSGVRLYE